jgi:hypothetical protein
VVYDLLFKASSEAVLTIAADPEHFFSRTPGPPPFSSMNLTPAALMARRGFDRAPSFALQKGGAT